MLKGFNMTNILIIIYFIVTTILLTDCKKLFSVQSCEGHKMKLFCHNNEIIKVKNANYGRTNTSICEIFEDAEEISNCISEGTTEIMRQICDEKKRCIVEATSRLFGDPCPGEVKYIEATYQCIPKEIQSDSMEINVKEKELLNMLNKLGERGVDGKEIKPEQAVGLLALFSQFSESERNKESFGKLNSNVFK